MSHQCWLRDLEPVAIFLYGTPISWIAMKYRNNIKYYVDKHLIAYNFLIKNVFYIRFYSQACYRVGNLVLKLLKFKW